MNTGDLDNTLADRKLAEAEFHNQRALLRIEYGEAEYQKRWANNKFYTITQKSTQAVADWIAAHCASGTTVLDYCCGQGLTALQMAEHGAKVHGIDISDEEIATARGKAREAGLEARTEFEVMDAENLKFADNSFDAIICNGVLHHLDVERAYPELARVLKPGGRILCIEALGYNPLIQMYRRRTPHLRTAWEVEHILTLKEITQAKKFFSRVSPRFYHLFSIAAVPFRNTPVFKPLLAVLDTLDAALLRVPYVQLMAWQMMFELSGPRKADRAAS